MKATFYLKSATTGTITSDIVNLTGYANPSGTGSGCLKLSWFQLYNAGTLSNVVVSHSSDKTTWSTLWDLGGLSGTTTYKNFYSFYPYVRVSASFIAGSVAMDNGCRIQLLAETYGLPDWANVSICRAEDLAAVFPARVNPAANFETEYKSQQMIAKNQIHSMLLARNVDPNRIYTDGANNKPCIEGLRIAGAYLTWWAVGLGSMPLNADSFRAEQQVLLDKANECFESALSILHIDSGTDGDPVDSSTGQGTVYCYR